MKIEKYNYLEKEPSNTKNAKITFAFYIILIALSGSLLVSNFIYNKNANAATLQTSSTIETKYISKIGNVVPLSSKVYLTKTGKAFHLDLNCQYVRGKTNLTKTTIEETKDRYYPCLRCFK